MKRISMRKPNFCRITSSHSLHRRGMIVLSGTSHPELVRLICEYLDVPVGKCDVSYGSSRETCIQINESVRGCDVYIIQSGTEDVNNDIMEMLIMVQACKTSSARRIVAVMPYLPYGKQCKRRKRGPITSKLLAEMLCRAGITHLITLDLHAKEVQGFYDVPVDNLRASPYLIKYIETSVVNYRDAVIVARHTGCVARATSYADRLRLPLVVIHGGGSGSNEVDDGRNSPPPIPVGESSATDISYSPVKPTQTSSVAPNVCEYGVLPRLAAKTKPPTTLVGDVNGRIAIIVDSVIDESDHFIKTAEFLRDCGAYKVILVATHGLLFEPTSQLLEESVIDEVVVTNTVPHVRDKLECHKLRTVDVSPLLAEAVRRIHNDESMSYLFNDVSKED